MSLSVFIVSFFTWLLLTWSLDWQEVVVGLIVSLVISFIFKKYYKVRFSANFLVGLFKFFFIYLPVFVWEMFKANIDVASRVLLPGSNVKPGFVKIKTELKTEVAKLTLANSITLTPGTITLDVVNDELYVHWIDVTGISQEDKKSFYGKFEKILKGVYR